MKTFIKVTEIWIPDESRTQLEFASGLYGNLHEFKHASEHQHFAYGEGLPGKAWAAGHPIVMKKLEPNLFKRTEAAEKAGLTCGIALPIFSGDFLLAVVVFLCGDDTEHAGAVEVWSNVSSRDGRLALIDGYYGSLGQFEGISKQLQMAKSQGLPGQVWQSGMPILMEDIGNRTDFIRAKDAKLVGFTTGLGIPASKHGDTVYVMTFLSAQATPLAKRIQIWIPQGERLVCQYGHSMVNNNLAEIFETITPGKNEGALGRVWLTGMPSITSYEAESFYSSDLDNLNSMLAIPVIDQGQLKAIVTFLF